MVRNYSVFSLGHGRRRGRTETKYLWKVVLATYTENTAVFRAFLSRKGKTNEEKTFEKMLREPPRVALRAQREADRARLSAMPNVERHTHLNRAPTFIPMSLRMKSTHSYERSSSLKPSCRFASTVSSPPSCRDKNRRRHGQTSVTCLISSGF